MNRNFVQLIKQCVVDTIDSLKPTDTRIGTVISTAPLKIRISQKLELDADFLDLCEYLTDHKVTVTVGNVKKTYTVHTALKKGDSVVLLRKWGGQKYTVIDRIAKG